MRCPNTAWHRGGGVAQDAGVVVPADDAFSESLSAVVHSREALIESLSVVIHSRACR